MKYINTTLITVILVALYASSSFAGNTNDIIRQEMLRREKIVKEITKERDGFKEYKKKAQQKVQNYHGAIRVIKDRYIKNAQATGLIKQPPQAVVFVSFSMPTLSLKQIIQDAACYQIPVVIRGLYENSFRKTIEKIFELVKEDNKGGILINPMWFKKYDIKAVPAVVVSSGEGSEANEREIGFKKNGFDVVYGNIPLKRALTIIAEQGSAADVAKNILSRGGA